MENRAWIEKVGTLRATGSFADTMNYLEKVLFEFPEDPCVHYQIAWTHDALGKEVDAALSYENAIRLGLSDENLESALIGLGSTYRCLGDYQNSKRVLDIGITRFPENGALKVFRALTEYNLKNCRGSIEILLTELIRTSADTQIKKYARALTFYSDKLDEVFP